MGRKTSDSLPKKPLPNRVNIVITSNPMIHSSFENTFFIISFENAINFLSESIFSKRIVNNGFFLIEVKNNLYNAYKPI